LALTTRVVGTINSTGTSNAQAFDQSFGGIARFVFLPLVGDDYMIYVGAHGSRVFSVSDAGGPDVVANRSPVQLRERPELRVDGSRLVDTGQINASHVNSGGLELAAQKQQFLIQGEYERIGIERRASALANPHFSGWYVEGGWVLTGERRKYNASSFAFDAPTVDHPLDFANGTWGAFELAARYSVLDLNYREGLAGLAMPPTASGAASRRSSAPASTGI
jgi:phosphate-selective porin OprO/OprP